MGTGYVRNDTANNIADGNIINASDLDGEFDAVQSAFNASTGHTHDGTAGEGAPIETIGPSQDVVATASVLRPKTDNTVDLGTTSLEYKDLFLDGTAHIDTLDVDENASITGTLGVTGTTTLGTANITTGTITTADINGGNIDGTIIGATTAAAITGTTITGTSFVTSGDMTFGDNDKAIFGAGSDLQIYHDPANGSIVKDNGTGRLLLDSENGTGISLTSGGIAKTMISATKDGDVKLYYDNAAKLATTSTGIDVTGTVTADGLTVDGTTDGTEELARFGNNAGTQELIIEQDGSTGYAIKSSVDLRLYADYDNDTSDAGSNIEMYTDGTQRMSITGSTGDISFYEDTGTTAKFFWDASAESLSIGSPSADNVTIYSTDDVPRLEFEQGGTVYADIGHRGASAGARQNIFEISTKQSEPMAFRTNNTERMRIDSSGQLILQSNPSTFFLGGSSNGSFLKGTSTGGYLIFGTSSSEVARFSGSNLGIGTSSPNRLLHVEGTPTTFGDTQSLLQIADDTAMAAGVGGGLVFTGKATTGQSDSNTAFAGIHGEKANGTSGNTSGAMVFSTRTSGSNPAERMRIDSSGDLTVKGGRIFVNESDNGNTAIGLTRDADEGYVQVYSAGSITSSIRGNGDSYFNGGNVGIGTSSPTQALHVESSSVGVTRAAVINTGNAAAGAGVQFITKNGATQVSNATLRTDNAGNFNIFTGTTGDTERLRIDSSGNLLVGKTTSDNTNNGHRFLSDGFVSHVRNNDIPMALYRKTSDGEILRFSKDSTTVGSIGTTGGKLQVSGTGNNAALIFDHSNTRIEPYTSATTDLGRSAATFKDLYLSGKITNDGTGGIQIDTSGNVGIGTTSPQSELHVSSSANADLRLSNDTVGNTSSDGLTITMATNGNASINNRENASTLFYTNNSEAMRIDSSGNLLVGTTSTDPQSSSSNSGVQIGDGFVFAGRTGEVAIFNRQTTDGEIAVFRKDGSTVGSIGTATNGTLTFGDLSTNLTVAIGTNDTSLKINGSVDAIYPGHAQTGDNRDALVDIGRSTVRFKDLYLSGGVYLGGVGSANKLDDYEEGTWTPTSPTVTFTSNVGTYTKVGNRIFVDCSFVVPSTASGVSFYIDNLPFTSSSAAAGAGFYMRYTDDSTFRMFYMLSSGTRAQVYNLGGGATTLAEVSGHRFDFSGTYFTA